MSILLNRETKVLVQGITGKTGRVQTKWMLDYGTNVVAGVTPGRGSEEVEGVPVYNTIDEAVHERGAEASVFFVPAAATKDAALQTLKAGIGLIVIVTEHIPVHDTMDDVQRFHRWLIKRMPKDSVPGIIPFIVFVRDQVELDLVETPIPVLRYRQLKNRIRKIDKECREPLDEDVLYDIEQAMLGDKLEDL